MTNHRSIHLSPGWQARLRVVHRASTPYVTKTFGIGLNWTRKNLDNVVQCAETYSCWLSNSKLRVNPRIESTKRFASGEWHYIASELYLGPDCEHRLLSLRTKGSLAPRLSIVTQLIDAAHRIIRSPNVSNFRCEVKPRDFCISDNSPVIIDTFPPVLANRNGTYVIATQLMGDNCHVPRERREVLSITGSPLGILRNFAEHLFAIDCLPREVVIAELMNRISDTSPQVTEELRRYLETPQSTSKVALLASQIGRRRYACLN